MMEAAIKAYCEFWWLFSSKMRLVEVEEKNEPHTTKSVKKIKRETRRQRNKRLSICISIAILCNVLK